MEFKTNITVGLSQNVIIELDKIANKKDISRGKLIREIINFFLKQRKQNNTTQK